MFSYVILFNNPPPTLILMKLIHNRGALGKHVRLRKRQVGCTQALSIGTLVLIVSTHALSVGTLVLIVSTHALSIGTLVLIVSTHALSVGTHVENAITHTLLLGTLVLIVSSHALCIGTLVLIVSSHALCIGTHVPGKCMCVCTELIFVIRLKQLVSTLKAVGKYT